jgi:hypothetical protein
VYLKQKGERLQRLALSMLEHIAKALNPQVNVIMRPNQLVEKAGHGFEGAWPRATHPIR